MKSKSNKITHKFYEKKQHTKTSPSFPNRFESVLINWLLRAREVYLEKEEILKLISFRGIKTKAKKKFFGTIIIVVVG